MNRFSFTFNFYTKSDEIFIRVKYLRCEHFEIAMICNMKTASSKTLNLIMFVLCSSMTVYLITVT